MQSLKEGIGSKNRLLIIFILTEVVYFNFSIFSSNLAYANILTSIYFLHSPCSIIYQFYKLLPYLSYSSLSSFMAVMLIIIFSLSNRYPKKSLNILYILSILSAAFVVFDFLSNHSLPVIIYNIQLIEYFAPSSTFCP